jgi:hypothetical protein
MEFTNVEFKRYGNYSIRIVVENIEVASISFRVSQSLEKQQTPDQA